MKRIAAIIGGTLLVMGLALPALANHPATTDAGVDTPWTNDMNQEAYWEALFGAECTKFERHNGTIPVQYDAAVIKSGSTLVRVYDGLESVGQFQALGPANPNAQHPNRRFEPPFSWVMKCINNQAPTTTTTVSPTTTTTEVDETTTTTVAETTTTTGTPPTPTTEVPTTTIPFDEIPTTTVLETTTTLAPVVEVETLPYTGMDPTWLGGLAALLGSSGAYLVRKNRR